MAFVYYIDQFTRVGTSVRRRGASARVRPAGGIVQYFPLWDRMGFQPEEPELVWE